MAVEPGPARPAPRIRRRLLAVGVAAGLVAGAGIGLDRVGARAAGTGTPAGAVTGAWYCPHGGAPGWRAWIVLANPTPAPVRVRLTELGSSGTRRIQQLTVPAGAERFAPVAGTDPADGTEVEYFGGRIGAEAILAHGSTGPGLAAEPCEAATRRAWYALDAFTGPGSRAWLVVMNPFSEAAEVDVSLLTEKRTVTPGPLAPYVLPAGRTAAIRVNPYLLAGQGERTVAARVHARIGRVVVGSLVATDAGLRLAAGLTAPRSRIYLPGGADTGTRELIVVDPGAERSDLAVMAESASGQELLSGEQGVSVEPGGAATFRYDALRGLGAFVQSTNERPVFAAMREAQPSGDTAVVGGAAPLSSAWLVLPTGRPGEGAAFLLLQNPGHRPVAVRYRLLGPGGAVGRASSVTIPAGRMLTLPIEAAPGGEPVAVAVESTGGGTFVAAGASSSQAGAYAAAIGVPMKFSSGG